MGYGTEMDGCGKFMKYSLFFTNFIICIGGLILVGLSIWAFVDKVPYIGELVGNDLLSGTVYVLLISGIVVSVISFFGCIGASREVKCMLITYSLIVLILFITLLVGGCLAYVFRHKLLDTIEQQMRSSLRFYDTSETTREAWAITQRNLHCCGIRDPRDWSQQGYTSLPPSCCREVQPGQYMNCNSGPDASNPSNTYQEGCLEGTKIFMQRHAAVLGGAGIIVACLMIFAILFSCILVRMID